MDEFFETLTLVQTGVIYNFPVVLMGTEYYGPLWQYLERMVKEKPISQNDLGLVTITDDVEEASCHIRKYITNNYKIKRRDKRLWWLGEN